MKWICCQLGAREHYAVPRALQLAGLLDQLITDLWIRPGAWLRIGRRSLTGRFHAGLEGAQVTAPNVATLSFELKAHAMRAGGWNLIAQRNDWFQQCALDQLRKRPANGSLTLFAYSYAAERIFEFARERGWRTVLGQIDPGPAEERVVAELHRKAGENHWKPAPAKYWDRWRNECELADQIVVNSTWSRNALCGEGVPPEKVRVLPVAYEAGPIEFARCYPTAFSSRRPLRVLFLGQINLRKGAGQLFDAAKILAREDVEFWLVGPTQVDIPGELKSNPRIRWFGAVPRLDVDRFYKAADVFILPTLSDGFGLTQLEAQSWKLPVIASRYCGDVVCDGVNGVRLEEVSGPAIAAVLLGLLRSPETLRALSASSGVSELFSLRMFASALTNAGLDQESC